MNLALIESEITKYHKNIKFLIQIHSNCMFSLIFSDFTSICMLNYFRYKSFHHFQHDFMILIIYMSIKVDLSILYVN